VDTSDAGTSYNLQRSGKQHDGDQKCHAVDTVTDLQDISSLNSASCLNRKRVVSSMDTSDAGTSHNLRRSTTLPDGDQKRRAVDTVIDLQDISSLNSASCLNRKRVVSSVDTSDAGTSHNLRRSGKQHDSFLQFSSLLQSSSTEGRYNFYRVKFPRAMEIYDELQPNIDPDHVEMFPILHMVEEALSKGVPRHKLITLLHQFMDGTMSSDDESNVEGSDAISCSIINEQTTNTNSNLILTDNVNFVVEQSNSQGTLFALNDTSEEEPPTNTSVVEESMYIIRIE
jgi:hypothetical protein